jgi:bifunctional oligoribonuclease and PAP phosphatase NrnA
MKISKEKIHELIHESNQILLTTHENPDGDGLGSQIAMFNYISSLNKMCRIINITHISDNFQFLNENNQFETFNQEHIEWINNVDLTIVFDIGHSIRVGELKNYIFKDKISISIDHHPIKENEPFTYSWIDVNAPATGFMIWELLTMGNIEKPIDKLSAMGLYTALVTDTGSFKYSNTTSQSHIMASHLINSGVKPQEITKNVFESRKLLHIQLLGDALNSLNFKFNNSVAWVMLTQEHFKSRNANSKDIEGFADFVRSIENVEIAFTLIENEDKTIRVSFRSQGKYIINDIAKELGGGGHIYAAGAKVDSMSLEELEFKIINLIKKKVKVI